MSKPATPKPDCYACAHRAPVPGSAHSRCVHPSVGQAPAGLELMAVFASVGRMLPTIDATAAAKLNIVGDAWGIRNGWFNWPFNFDPVWLKACTGFTPAEEEAP